MEKDKSNEKSVHSHGQDTNGRQAAHDCQAACSKTMLIQRGVYAKSNRQL